MLLVYSVHFKSTRGEATSDIAKFLSAQVIQRSTARLRLSVRTTSLFEETAKCWANQVLLGNAKLVRVSVAPMESIHIRQRIRPSRYAFIVNEGDLAAALQAVSLITALWGARALVLVAWTVIVFSARSTSFQSYQ